MGLVPFAFGGSFDGVVGEVEVQSQSHKARVPPGDSEGQLCHRELPSSAPGGCLTRHLSPAGGLIVCPRSDEECREEGSSL